MLNKILLFIGLLSLTLACNNSKETSQKDDLLVIVDSFLTCYFNYDLLGANGFVHPESKKWITFLASNIHQEDLDSLKTFMQEPSYEIKDVQYINDSLALVRCKASCVYELSQIGATSNIVKSAEYSFNMVKVNNKWLIKMEGPLRNEMKNHD